MQSGARARLRVAVDGTPLLGVRTGIGYTTAAIIDALAGRDDLDLVAYAITFRGRSQLAALTPTGVRAGTRRIPARLVRTLWRHADTPHIERWTGPVDVVHATNFVAPPANAPTIVTVHDLAFARHPDLTSRTAQHYDAFIRRALDRGAVVHTVSDYVATEVQEEFGLAPERVVRIYPGLHARGAGSAERGRAIAGAPRYVLFVGEIGPRKNIPRLVRAFFEVAETDPDLHLVLAGPPGPDTDQVEALVRESRHRGRVLVTGYVSDEARLDLLAGSALFAFPSLDEGFGHPPLDAMAAGVPVVAAAAGAIPEVVGDAALLVDPTDVSALANGIEQVLRDESLRAALIERGDRQWRKFSWDTTACELAALYHRVAQR
jgi:glycosyltransferase involved in cell wall biosynthesis